MAKEQRKRNVYPVKVFESVGEGAMATGWGEKEGDHKDSAAAWQWVKKNGEAGRRYMVCRCYGQKTLAVKVTETTALED